MWQRASCMSMLPVIKDRGIWMGSASRKTIAACYTYHYFLNVEKYSALMTTITGKWLSMDHTFKTAANIGRWSEDAKWRTLYDSVFLVMNEKKEVLSWVFAKTAGFIHVRHPLLKIKDRFNRENIQIHGLVIDNCCQWRSLLQSIFGQVPVKLDLFHGVIRITSTVSKKHQFFHVFRADFRMVFRNVMDRFPRREMPTAAQLMKNLTTFKSHWEVIPSNVDYDQWLDSLCAGVDKENEKFLLPAVANILQIPIIVFTSHESFPVISVIPVHQTVQLSPGCILSIAYNHSVRHFSGVSTKVLKMNEPKTRESEFTSDVISCRCGQGRNRNKPNITSCDSFEKRCKCFQALRGCGGNCQCLNCENPRGKRDVTSKSTTTHSASAPRKRQRMNLQNYFSNRGRSRVPILQNSTSK